MNHDDPSLVPNVPYFDLPAGLMAPLVKVSADFRVRPLGLKDQSPLHNVRDSLTWTFVISNLSIQRPSARGVVGHTWAGVGGGGRENGDVFKRYVLAKAI